MKKKKKTSLNEKKTFVTNAFSNFSCFPSTIFDEWLWSRRDSFINALESNLLSHHLYSFHSLMYVYTVEPVYKGHPRWWPFKRGGLSWWVRYIWIVKNCAWKWTNFWPLHICVWMMFFNFDLSFLSYLSLSLNAFSNNVIWYILLIVYVKGLALMLAAYLLP